MTRLWLLLIFLFGLAFGSLANVLIARRSELGTVFLGRSHCPDCRVKLSAVELVPVISYLWLKGRCRHCGKTLSWQYPVVEIAMGLVFLLLAGRTAVADPLGLLKLLLLLLVFFFLLVLFVTDLYDQAYPSLLLSLTVGLSLLYGLIVGLSERTLPLVLIGGLLGAGAIGLLYLITRRAGMGEGDVVLGLSLGLILSYPAILLGLAIAFILGGAVAAWLLLSHQRRLSDRLAFGPFLVTAAFLMVLFREEILIWFLV